MRPLWRGSGAVAISPTRARHWGRTRTASVLQHRGCPSETNGSRRRRPALENITPFGELFTTVCRCSHQGKRNEKEHPSPSTHTSPSSALLCGRYVGHVYHPLRHHGFGLPPFMT